MDCLTFHNVALSPLQISALYAAGGAVPSTTVGATMLRYITTPAPLMQLPPALWPAQTQQLNAGCCVLQVSPSGAVTVTDCSSCGGITRISLDGVRYPLL